MIMANTKAKKLLQPYMDKLHRERNEAIAAVKPLLPNPQVAGMIEKNKGYIMALEDITEFMYRNKLF